MDWQPCPWGIGHDEENQVSENRSTVRRAAARFVSIPAWGHNSTDSSRAQKRDYANGSYRSLGLGRYSNGLTLDRQACRGPRWVGPGNSAASQSFRSPRCSEKHGQKPLPVTVGALPYPVRLISFCSALSALCMFSAVIPLAASRMRRAMPATLPPWLWAMASNDSNAACDIVTVVRWTVSWSVLMWVCMVD